LCLVPFFSNSSGGSSFAGHGSTCVSHPIGLAFTPWWLIGDYESKLDVIGCDSVWQKAAVVAPVLSPEESLRKLILLLGPWPPAEKERAENFAMRFLKAEHAPGSSIAPAHLLAVSGDKSS